jgi:hypothetical protein
MIALYLQAIRPEQREPKTLKISTKTLSPLAAQ